MSKREASLDHLTQQHKYWQSEHSVGGGLPELQGSVSEVVAEQRKTGIADCEKAYQHLHGQHAEIVEKPLGYRPAVVVLELQFETAI